MATKTSKYMLAVVGGLTIFIIVNVSKINQQSDLGSHYPTDVSGKTRVLESQLADLKMQIAQLTERQQYTDENVRVSDSAAAPKTTSDAIPASGSSSSSSWWQPISSAVACPEKGRKVFEKMGKISVKKKLFKSQFKEDEILMRWFGNLCNGTYLEMGALDGVTYSNSYAFHHGLDWKGVLLEASPNNFKKLEEKRPNDILIHSGVCAETSDLHWVEGNTKTKATGGFWEFASEIQKTKWFPKDGYEKSIIVRCEKLGTILKEKVGEHVFFDFYSLDIEGAEFAALQTIDFDKVSFGVILVEASGQNPLKDMAVHKYLESKGYGHFSVEGGDGNKFDSDWFVNKDWPNIYKDLIYAF